LIKFKITFNALGIDLKHNTFLKYQFYIEHLELQI